MPKYGERLIKKTQKGLSQLAFETSRQSRILKRRMQIFALQKEVKADLQDLGSIVFHGITRKSPAILDDEDVRILVEKIAEATHEIDRLRDAISRISRVQRVLVEELQGIREAPAAKPDAAEELPPEGGEPAAKEAAPAAEEAAPKKKNPKQEKKLAKKAEKTAAKQKKDAAKKRTRLALRHLPRSKKTPPPDKGGDGGGEGEKTK